VKDSITQGESEGKSFYEITEASYTFGWRTFDQSCIEAFEQGLINEENAILYCSKKGVTSRGLDNVKKRRGESTTSLSNLKMRPEDHGAPKMPSGPSFPAGGLKLK
jgi:twitching motility protein PilT